MQVALLSPAMEDPKNPEKLPVEDAGIPPVEDAVILPGAVAAAAVAEVHIPVPTLGVTPLPADATATVYSPRSNFVPPDAEVAKLHAKENRPMYRDALGDIVPYVLALCNPCAAHNHMIIAGIL